MSPSLDGEVQKYEIITVELCQQERFKKQKPDKSCVQRNFGHAKMADLLSKIPQYFSKEKADRF